MHPYQKLIKQSHTFAVYVNLSFKILEHFGQYSSFSRALKYIKKWWLKNTRIWNSPVTITDAFTLFTSLIITTIHTAGKSIDLSHGIDENHGKN